jgi:hypothetical protein
MSVPADQLTSGFGTVGTALFGGNTFDFGSSSENAGVSELYTTGLLSGENSDTAITNADAGYLSQANPNDLFSIMGQSGGSSFAVGPASQAAATGSSVASQAAGGYYSTNPNGMGATSTTNPLTALENWIANISWSSIVMVIIGILCIFAALFLFGFDQLGKSDTAKTVVKTVASNPEILA